MKAKKYLNLYTQWMQDNQIMPHAGLCNALTGNMYPFRIIEALELFRPTPQEVGKYKCSPGYWLNDEPFSQWDFNDTRQNVVLFLAAMNNEL